MRHLVVGFALVFLVAFARSGSACVDCIAQHCVDDDGFHTVCDEFPPPGHGCVASGFCPPAPMACLGNTPNLRLVNVVITRPADSNIFQFALQRNMERINVAALLRPRFAVA
jgi:hypothetical protein